MFESYFVSSLLLFSSTFKNNGKYFLDLRLYFNVSSWSRINLLEISSKGPGFESRNFFTYRELKIYQSSVEKTRFFSKEIKQESNKSVWSSLVCWTNNLIIFGKKYSSTSCAINEEKVWHERFLLIKILLLLLLSSIFGQLEACALRLW